MNLITAFLLMILTGKVKTHINNPKALRTAFVQHFSDFIPDKNLTEGKLYLSPQDIAHLNICRNSSAPMRTGIYL